MTVKYHTSADGSRNICTAQYACRLGGGHVSRAELVVEANRRSDEDGPSPFQAVADKLEDHNQAHYRMYLSPRTNEPTAVCVQWFDYGDYDSSRFLDDEVYFSKDEADYAAQDFNDAEAPAWMRRKLSKAEAVHRENVKNSKSGTEAFGDVLDQLDHHDDVHYRPYLNRDGTVKMVCVQYFDYWERDGDRFLGKDVYFTEDEANAALPEWV